MSNRTEFGMEKAIGEFGVFAVNSRTGWTAGVPNADAPALAEPPLSTDPAAHNAAVREYFVSAGLPELQILEVKDFTGASASGKAGEQLDPTKLRLEFYISQLSRQTPSGIPVPDSYASARINANRDVVKETIYWPDIDASVVTQAEALRTVVEDVTMREAYVAKIPGKYASLAQNGNVAIRHTPGGWNGDFVAQAVYDVPYPSGHRTLHFDANGAEVQLPHETSETAQQ